MYTQSFSWLTIQKSLFKYNQWKNEIEGHQIGYITHPRFESYDDKTNKVILSFPIESWTQNQNGAMHSGMISTMLDSAMGAFVFCITGKYSTTETIQIKYLAPIPITARKRLIILSSIIECAEESLTASSEAYLESSPDKLLAAANGTYYIGG